MKRQSSRTSLKAIILFSGDNVAIATANIKKGDIIKLGGNNIKVLQNIPGGHKFAVKNIGKNKEIVKYGQTIALAAKNISIGDHVHVHNIHYTKNIQFDFKQQPDAGMDFTGVPKTFKGFMRSHGKAGTRNYILVVAPVNCSATVVHKVADYFKSKKLARIDSVVPVSYGGGCALADSGDNCRVLRKTISGWITNPNVVGTVIIGLGCETVDYGSIIKDIPGRIRKTISAFNIQESGGAKRAVEKGIAEVKKIHSKLPVFKRTDIPVSKLVLALNCGGSDAFSGLSANPALGIASDFLVHNGGTAVLAEFPECHGAEKHLMGRCARTKDRIELKKIMKWWDKYTKDNNVELNDNISKGNIEGGISTILEKSLGAIAKAGHTRINQVVRYAEPVTRHGLIFMDTPGFDPVSVTGLIAGGCNCVAFTTGKGSLYGASIAPTIKISSNTEIYLKMQDDMDINAGIILDGEDIFNLGKSIYCEIIDAAGGNRTKSEKFSMGKYEFVPWQFGEIL